MKKYLFLMIAAALLAGNFSAVNAQNANEAKDGKKQLTEDQIIQKRTEQMERVLMLDDAVAAKFAPVYTQYLKDKMDCRKINGKKVEGKKDFKMENKTDAEVDAIIKEQFAQSRKVLEINENYYAKFRNILSPKQVLKIYQSERDLQSKMRMEKQNRNSGKGRFHGDKN